MQEYTYQEFMENAGIAGRRVVEAIHRHITQKHPQFKPYGILPKDKTRKEWSLHFRKHPQHGKPLCSLFINNGTLSIRLIFDSPMTHEVLLRLDEFGDQVRAGLLLACRCRGCGSFGDREFCWCQHHYYVNDELLYGCNTTWYSIDNIAEGELSGADMADLLYLCDLQSRHMTQDSKGSRGAGYADENCARCGSPLVVKLNRMDLSVDHFAHAEYTDVQRLDRYAEKYHLTPMGVNDGVWLYFDDRAVCGTPGEGCAIAAIPECCCAMVTVSNPFSFSVVRIWDYLCLWTRRRQLTITSADMGGIKTPMFVKFFRQEETQYMQMYVTMRDVE